MENNPPYRVLVKHKGGKAELKIFKGSDKLPKTPSGKISRRQLENIPLAPEYSAGVSTENTIEKVVSKLMADVLERSGFSKHDDFFDIGGDSLAAFNLISKLEVKFGINFFFCLIFFKILPINFSLCERTKTFHQAIYSKPRDS